ncbi:transcription termination/antitermination protein NusG [Bradyrhizobium sp. 930_D9_N1_4]|uniref:transcription termination/antitermination protein NusG n=1 Tax=Bradyrhizobium sp. 930_D9_N1_4 TaxID=3240374 RepID=UPI003F8A2E56
MVERYWTVAQTVSRMEHVVRRDLEKADHGAFVPTYARRWSVDGRSYAKECALFTGYVFFMTDGDGWAGIPDIYGVYRVPANPDGKPHRVKPAEMLPIVLGHAAGDHDKQEPARFTRYYNPQRAERQRRDPVRRRPRRSKRARANPDPCSS